jgi:hypothetical protein
MNSYGGLSKEDQQEVEGKRKDYNTLYCMYTIYIQYIHRQHNETH